MIKLAEFIVITECAIEHNGKFLLIKRPPGSHAEGLLSFPGGKFETSDAMPGIDALKQTAKREVLEELGINLVDPLHYVTRSHFMDTKTGSHLIDIIYHCQLQRTRMDVKASAREVAAYYWLTYDEILAEDNCPEWLITYMNAIRNLTYMPWRKKP